MDPDITLAAIRWVLDRYDSLDTFGQLDDATRLDYAASLAENVRGLDDWLRKGGYLPHAWAAAAGNLPLRYDPDAADNL